MRAPTPGKSHFFIALAAALLTGSILAGCEPTSTAKQASSNGASESTQASKVAPKDDPGTTTLRVVASQTLPTNPQRVVTLAPNVTEVIFALGAGERIVAVTRYDDYPAKVKKLPKIGGIIDVDLEAILAQKPDLVLGTSAGSDGNLVAKLEKSKIPYLFVQMNTLEETYGGIQKFGDTLGLGEKAAEIRADMQSKIDAIAKSATRVEQSKPRVMLVYGHDPLVAAGPGSFGHEMLELAGGANVLGDSLNPYPVLDIEKILSLNPERIIDATIAPDGPDKVDAPSSTGAFWAKYSTLSAVKTNQVHYFDDPVLHRPAPRLVEGLEIMHKAIRGDAQESADALKDD